MPDGLITAKVETPSLLTSFTDEARWTLFYIVFLRAFIILIFYTDYSHPHMMRFSFCSVSISFTGLLEGA